LNILRAALNLAFKDKKVATDLAWDRVEPFEGADAVREGYFKRDECARLINAADPDFRPLIQAALLTGARYGQLAGTRVADFDEDAGTLRVTSAKGRGPSKTYHVQLTNEGVRFFVQLAAGRQRGERLLRHVDDGSPWLPSQQGRPMREACERAGIKPAMSFHMLRHTYASLAIMAGASPFVVSRNLGHSDTRMVEKHYGHLAPSHIRDMIEATALRIGFGLDRKLAAPRG
jgi:integrase